jgi:Methyltransferase domain
LSIHDIIRIAVEEFGAETRDLEFLPENRYNKRMFPTTGQYDWFSGQVLYCLIRFLKPIKILEISMASGYSTMFMAMAAKRNNRGRIDSFELDSKVEKAAAKLFKKCGVDKLVQSYVGDARKKSVTMPSDYGIYFLDSLHTEDFARWFIDAHVMRAERTDALFHMHDIMPLHARVRRWNRPPFDGDEFEEKSKKSWLEEIKRKAACFVYPPSHSENRRIPIKVYPAEENGGPQTFDGNCTTEAIWGTKLAALMKWEDHVFLHDIANQYPQLTPRKYDHVAVGRTDSRDVPMEWNETWWCKVAAFKEIYHRFKETEEKKK